MQRKAMETYLIRPGKCSFFTASENFKNEGTVSSWFPKGFHPGSKTIF